MSAKRTKNNNNCLCGICRQNTIHGARRTMVLCLWILPLGVMAEAFVYEQRKGPPKKAPAAPAPEEAEAAPEAEAE